MNDGPLKDKEHFGMSSFVARVEGMREVGNDLRMVNAAVESPCGSVTPHHTNLGA